MFRDAKVYSESGIALKKSGECGGETVTVYRSGRRQGFSGKFLCSIAVSRCIHWPCIEERLPEKMTMYWRKATWKNMSSTRELSMMWQLSGFLSGCMYFYKGFKESHSFFSPVTFGVNTTFCINSGRIYLTLPVQTLFLCFRLYCPNLLVNSTTCWYDYVSYSCRNIWINGKNKKKLFNSAHITRMSRFWRLLSQCHTFLNLNVKSNKQTYIHQKLKRLDIGLFHLIHLSNNKRTSVLKKVKLFLKVCYK